MIISPKHILITNNFILVDTKILFHTSSFTLSRTSLQSNLVGGNMLTHLVKVSKKLLNLTELGQHLGNSHQN